jgi:hypothetical protein
VIWESIAAFPCAVEVSPELKMNTKYDWPTLRKSRSWLFMQSSQNTFENWFVAYRLKFSGRAVREIGEAFDW